MDRVYKWKDITHDFQKKEGRQVFGLIYNHPADTTLDIEIFPEEPYGEQYNTKKIKETEKEITLKKIPTKNYGKKIDAKIIVRETDGMNSTGGMRIGFYHGEMVEDINRQKQQASDLKSYFIKVKDMIIKSNLPEKQRNAVSGLIKLL